MPVRVHDELGGVFEDVKDVYRGAGVEDRGLDVKFADVEATRDGLAADFFVKEGVSECFCLSATGDPHIFIKEFAHQGPPTLTHEG